ncbi:hypothetical protein Hrd1104_06475 [Halorhabdus sp. CBA1104]|uniref:hypothetical protein n=1 Tax=Halorhabdus sp. CBA1104 TaxID=1380432 RepID=UPI0012B43D31|nr:hypothetical protein [Halorhabdus sp. CBA1104]QGN06973.1 hypothetical protein Hrd1104_06475 [Halorhabdus sp. CBA1104]
MERATLVKVLLVVAIGIPLVIEGATFLSLFNQHLGSEDTAGTETPAPETLSVGDDLLTDFGGENVTATIENGSIQATGDAWLFTLEIAVRNSGNQSVAVSVGPLTTGDGTVGETVAESGEIAPAGSTTVFVQWSLPTGETPQSLTVTRTRYGNETTTADGTVQIGGFPVQR